MDKQTELSAVILNEAKRQYYSGEIEFSEYEEILHLIYNRLCDIENSLVRKDHLLKTFSNADFKIKLIDTINITLAMN